jgi:hypothetical protein
MARTTETDLDSDEPMGMTWSVGRVLIVLSVLAMVAFWAWIFSGAPARFNPDYLDRSYAAELENRCEALREELAAYPNAIDAVDQDERADILDDTNPVVEAFIDDLEAGAPTTGDAATSVDGWIQDWRIYLANREEFADRLRTEENAQLLLDRSPLGDSVDKTIQIFAQVNEIEACETPGDVG